MQSKSLIFALVAGSALAAPEHQKRQAANSAEFQSAVNQLVSAYVPPAAALSVGMAIQSAASAQGVTGDLNSIVANALAQPTPPSYLTAVPSQYQPNLASLGSAISALRGAASTGIPGAPVISTDSAGNTATVSTRDAVTTTNTAGSSIVAVTGPVTDSAGSTLTGVTSTISSITGSPASASQPTGAVITTDSAGSTVTGLAVTTTNSAGSTVTSLTTTLSYGSSTDTINSVSGSSTSSGTSSGTSSSSSTSGVTTSSTTATSSTTSTSTSRSTVTSASTTTTSTQTSSSPAPSSSTSSGAAAVGLAPGAGGVVGLVAFLLAL